MDKKRRQNLLIGSAIGALLFLALLAIVFPTSATSLMLADVMEPTKSEQSAFSVSATLESSVLLPILHRDPTSTPTPTPTPLPQSILRNGGFEQGPVVWAQSSSNSWELILQDVDLPVPPRNGTWAAWLGGDDNEASILSQDIFIASGASTLRYGHWIASGDICNPDYDIAGVFIDDTVVDAFLLCEAGNTNGWIMRTVDLSAYQGQSAVIHLTAFTDSVLNSNLFIDDVSLRSASREMPENRTEDSDSTITKPTFLEVGVVGEAVTGLFESYRIRLLEFVSGNLDDLPADSK